MTDQTVPTAVVESALAQAVRLRIERAEALRALAAERLSGTARAEATAAIHTAITAIGDGSAAPPFHAAEGAVTPATVEEARRKAEQAEADREEKRKPYEADPLFMYLWRRRFGTGSYRASPPVRYLDAKVARLIGYDGARANYAMLLELPRRLRGHADRLAAEAGGRSSPGTSYRAVVAPLDRVEARPDLQALLSGAPESPHLQRIRELDRALAEQERALGG